MESIIGFVCEHATDAHWIIFILLMLAGLNVPISEDVLLLTGGIISSTCFNEPSQFATYYLYVWIFFGCWLSAWEAYWIGRLLGPKLYSFKWFSRVITPHRIERLHHYYEKFGLLTFIVGRFCPGGVRNALFITSGLGRMPFLTFVARDGLACLISSSTLFYVGHIFGENYGILLHYFKRYQLIVAAVLIIVFVSIISVIAWKRKCKKTQT